MENDNGKSYYGISLDNSQLEQDAAKASQILSGIDKEAQQQSAAVRELLSNIPTVNIDIVSNAATTLDSIDAAFAEIDRVVDTNAAAIRELEKEYERLGQEQSKAFSKGDDKSARSFEEQRRAIKEVIKVRKQVNKEAAATADELAEEEQHMKKDAEATANAQAKHSSFRAELMNARNEMRQLISTGQQNTAQYEATRQKVVELAQAMNAANKQTKALASPTMQFQGIISGLQGISGAAAVAQGALGLYGAENEKLQKTMLKVQSIMAIVMGLQQVQQTLNKNSAFSLVTLNSLKQVWNKLLGNSATAQAAETAAVETNTAAEVGNTAATNANTAAQTTNNTSSVTGTTAQVANKAATQGATAATIAQTVATKAASLALKGLKVALISTGIGALIVLVGELVGWLVQLFDTTSQADKEFEEQQEIISKGAEAYAKASLEIENYKTRLEKFNGTKQQEKELVKELNNKYGEALGYYSSLEEWKRVLIEKGDAYCNTLLKEAEAQAILSKYTEAFINLKEIEGKVANGDYSHWYQTSAADAKEAAAAVADATAEVEKWKKQYKETMNEATSMRQNFDIGGHTDPTSVKPRSGGNKSSFDPEKAALETQKAIVEYRNAVSKYVKNANDELNHLIIDAQEQGLVKELNEIRRGTRQKLEAWNEQLERLAEARKNAAKTQYMQQDGATEVGWSKTADGQKSTDDWINVIKQESPDVIAEFDRVWQQITDNGNEAIKQAQQRYHNSLVEEFGTQQQKEDLLLQQWMQKIAYLPSEFVGEATRQMDEAFAKLDSDRFKSAINWESVFGDLSQQALPVLKFTLGKVRSYFEQNKDAMSTQEIKDYQEAITNMEDEIANRNPFTALHKAIRDLGASKTELVEAFNELKTAQEEIKIAIQECKDAQEAYNEILDKVEDGEIEEGCEEQTEAYERLTKAKNNVTSATNKQSSAEQKYIRAQNKATSSYKRVSSSLKSAGKVINYVGGKAKNLAAVFSSDLSKGIGKALDFMDEMLDATSDVIDAVGDVSESAAQGIEQTVEGAAAGSTTAAAAGASAIQTIERASVILAVISAALQVATAIANLFNNDDKKQEDIEKLQERIDQLQWELDNKEAVRLSDNYGDALSRIKKLYAESTNEIINMYAASSQYGGYWGHLYTVLAHKGEIYEKTVEKIADAYASVAYTADKALGSQKYDESRKQLENLAEQQMLVQEQMGKESSKKKTDDSKIQDYKNQLAEIAEEMATIINEMVEDIIGYTAEDLASELGDAFFEAAQAGEDAMEAWHDKVNEIVGDIIKRMLITQYLEPQIGKIFDKYKKQWFGNDGTFKGIQAVIDSSNQMAADINEAGNLFNQIYEGLSDNLKDYFAATDESRSASEEGITTASQDTVDELNGRMTAVQGHTYNICEYTKQLVTTTSLILQSVLNIESETDGFGSRLERMESNLKSVKDAVDDIALKGIKIQ